MTGHVLVHAGRYREAEDMLRQSLASAQAKEGFASAQTREHIFYEANLFGSWCLHVSLARTPHVSKPRRGIALTRVASHAGCA